MTTGYYPTQQPRGDFQQEWNWRYPGWPPLFTHAHRGPRRNAPAELPFKEHRPDRGGGWWQGDRKLNHFKPNYYFTRPCDGKRTGALGRMKDALTGEGPDVFLTMSGDKRSLMRDRPQRHQWSGWGLTAKEILDRRIYDMDWRACDEMPVRNMTWTHDRMHEPMYDFRPREFLSPRKAWRNQENVWTNVDWAPGAKSGSLPLSSRDYYGNWTTRVPQWAGRYPGGRPWPRD
ncbi:hypothetical protein LTR78_007077 [Recurvomyces mirabilis]|uniref:Uncharacterized protein n=1 Tax=Recurvomyces mirabilis TaxID=574656 RepID=A0AAE0WJP3_9PEZI|nr:hypothetical protein LTR78_007077 [Recurvomyces mirabilis]KAK5150951.1 hypothetical protein LTS14_009755 [Recurvomyces mirabilis]